MQLVPCILFEGSVSCPSSLVQQQNLPESMAFCAQETNSVKL